MSEKHKFRVTVSRTVTIEFNDSLVPDDDWRRQFYPSIRRPQDLAEHIAYNLVVNGVESLSKLDGFADKPDRLLKFDLSGEWDVDSEEDKNEQIAQGQDYAKVCN